MGAPRASARASYSLWRAAQTCNYNSGTQNCMVSADTVPLKNAGALFSSTYAVNHVRQFSTTFTGSCTYVKEILLSFRSGFCQRPCPLANYNRSLHIPRTGTTVSVTLTNRNISSHAFISKTNQEDIEVRHVENKDILEDDAAFPVEDDLEPVKSSLPDDAAKRKADLEALFLKIECCTRPSSNAVNHIKSYIKKGNDFLKEDAVLLISKLRRYSRYKQAAEISDWMLDSKIFSWTILDQAVRLSVKGKLGLSSEVERIFNDSPPELQQELAYNAVIRHFCERGMVKKSTEWIEKLTKSGLVSQPFAFNRMLQLYKDRGMGDKAPEILEAMRAAKISKDNFTYNILMSIKVKQGDIPGLEKIFEECKADPNVTVDAPTYATLANGYINAGLTEKATAALEAGEVLIIDKKGNVDEVIATLWGKLGNKEKVSSLWESMKGKPVVASRTYVVMIETFGKLGMVEQAEMMFQEMEQKKGAIRPRQLSALIAVYVMNKMNEKVETLVGRISSMGLKMNATLAHHVIGAYLKLGRLDRALAFASEVETKSDFTLWFPTLVGLLDAAAERGDVIVAEQVFGNLSSSYAIKSQAVYNTVLKAYMKAGQPVEGFIDRMAVDKILPNKETHELLQLCSGKETSVTVDVTSAV